MPFWLFMAIIFGAIGIFATLFISPSHWWGGGIAGAVIGIVISAASTRAQQNAVDQAAGGGTGKKGRNKKWLMNRLNETED